MIQLLLWFDENPVRYWWLVYTTVAVVACVAYRPLLRTPSAATDEHGPDWRWGLAIFALLLAGRWPYLVVSTELNADESQMLAGAITLRHDPVFWRSVDGNTAGPLDFYALLPASWVFGPVGYLPARVTSLLLLGSALWLLHAGVARLGGRTAARIATLPSLAFTALTTHRDFTHYSTEQLPLLLLGAAFFLGVGEFQAAQPRRWVRFCLGLVLGAVPLAKLQGIPLGAALAGLLVCSDLRRPGFRWNDYRGAWLAMVAGALVPAAGFGAMALATGEWDNALASYIHGNLSYATNSGFTLARNLDRLAANIAQPGDLVPWWVGGTFLFAIGAVATRRPPPAGGRAALPTAVALLLVGVFAVLAPNRPYAHYLFFLLPPLVWVTAACAARLIDGGTSASRSRRALTVGLLLLGPAAVLAGRVGRPHPQAGLLAAHAQRPPSEAVRLIIALAPPGEPLAVWGWMSSYHVETGRHQALRESHSDYQISPGPLQPFYRQRYLADMRRNPPAIFVDATGPGNFMHTDRAVAHDAIFPELASHVRENYRLAAEANGCRIYARRTPTPPAGFDEPAGGAQKPQILPSP